MLFVGESPPANGAFFYLGSPMTKYMWKVFSGVTQADFGSRDEFLDFFKREGCFLDDLSHDPVDNVKNKSQRRSILDGCVNALAERMREYKPEFVVAVLKSIEDQVCRAAELANLQVPVYAVPFPGQGNQRRFVEELSRILGALYASRQ